MPTADFYRQKADECVAAAKIATQNEEKARQYALAEPLHAAGHGPEPV